ncbi:MAG: hypothetical protein H0X65_04260 [Gemmatimonadetes bacterium]|nr:hypothetical protein [Gemmatimonadota bacterium]
MAASTAEVRKLRGELEARFGGAIRPAGAPAPERASGFLTGVAALDRLLPGGVPRGAISLWTGERTSGRTAALRTLVLRACAEGTSVALVDAGRTLDATFGCTPAGPVEGLWVVRPPDPDRAREASWAAEALLRAGVFGLVVLDGCMPEPTQAHRLRALARERDTAVVISAEHGVWGAKQLRGSPAPRTPHLALPFRADVRLEFRRAQQARGLAPGGRFRRRTRVRLAKGDTDAPAGGEREVELVHEAADRLRPGRRLPDRSPGGR